MTKFKIETIPPGVLVCQIMEALSHKDGDQIITGIEKLLKNGKARIILNFTDAAAQSEAGAIYFEAGTRHLKEIASKMGGNILFVVPQPLTKRFPFAVTDLTQAIQLLLKTPDNQALDEQKADQELDHQIHEMGKLREENRLLKLKLEEFLEVHSQPSSESELKKAVEFYRNLAAQYDEVDLKKNLLPTET